MLKKIGLISLASMALAACGSSTSTSSTSSTHTVSLTRAAYVSGGSPGSKIVMSMRESVPGFGQVTMNANGTFSTAARQGAMTMQMSLPAASAAQIGGGSLQMQVVLAGKTIYMKLPPQLAAKIPGGKPWWKIDLSQAGKLAGIPGLSSLLSGTSNLSDPGQYLNFLRATASGSVTNLGSATVNGVQTTHYRAKIDFAKLPNAVPANERAAAQQLVAVLQQHGAAPHGLPVDVWVDSKNLIRRVQLTYAQPLPNGQSANIAIKVDYLDYGPQPAPTIPPASRTLDLLKLLGH
jgi:hypothetical protein